MKFNYKIGILGCGNMGGAILKGILSSKSAKPEEIIVCEHTEQKLDNIRSKYGVFATTDKSVLSQCEFVLFAIKPQGFSEVAKELTDINCAISIMAGIKAETIGKSLKSVKSICRIMPNTPCMIEKGMCAISYFGCDESEKAFINGVFNSLGQTVEVEESQFDAVTCVSGSGPAYVYYFINAMIEGGVRQGLSYEESKALTLQTFDGAVSMVRKSEVDIQTLIRNVCSKGGTTIQAINCFDDEKLGKIIEKGMEKCAARSAEMSSEFGK